MAYPAHLTKQDAEYLADQMGLYLVLPEPDELMLDLDCPGGVPNQRVWDKLYINGVYVVSYVYTTSKSGNSHLYIQLHADIDDMLRVALQAILGSDPVRELCGLKRIAMGSDAPSILLETEDGYKKCMDWRNSQKLKKMTAPLIYGNDTPWGQQ